MRQRLRSHLTFANVVSVLALFVALGGTAAAAVIITDNSQVAQNTISGHKPPSGKHANVIAGSVNGQDVADNSLGGADVFEPSLTGNARKLIYNATTAQLTTIASVGPYAIKADCRNLSPMWSAMRLWVNGPAGTANFSFILRKDDAGPASDTGPDSLYTGTVQIPAFQDKRVIDFSVLNPRESDMNGEYTRVAGTMMLRSGSVLVQLDLNGVADASNPRHFAWPCFLYGTGTLGT